ncbi:RimK family alpha-L-glutamate ligase [Candidatus Methanocrinis natronophilus]|uniref:RimK family alpha-L-glutamate ligase n=1 Tax=Candidatus Methanocrinis natronophilus TaxID=3033396 RepID=A0ABT5X9R2_9EURY|nr:RimK family alpha-L-glutamate ligase [Candidatus Methanocrinis natronophilus]MDF0591455.1 RimK family alpha-L-glutamate ligase [Candidatus Methanocrinis natronophilus]
MRFGVVVTDPSDWTAGAIATGLERQGADAVFLNFSQLAASMGTGLALNADGTDLLDLDGLVVRDLGRRGSSDVAFRFEVLSAVEASGVAVVNPPSAILRAANKFATSLALQGGGVPQPETLAATSLPAAEGFVTRHRRAVYKPLFGYKGRGLLLLSPDDPAPLRDALAKEGVVYLQEFLESTAPRPRDIRAFVVDGKVAGAIYRVAPPGSWISNLARGGAPERCPLTPEIEALALRAAAAVGTIYSGVDLLESPGGLAVLEVNGTPSGWGVHQAWGIDVGEMIASAVLRIAEGSI